MTGLAGFNLVDWMDFNSFVLDGKNASPVFSQWPGAWDTRSQITTGPLRLNGREFTGNCNIRLDRETNIRKYILILTNSHVKSKLRMSP